MSGNSSISKGQCITPFDLDLCNEWALSGPFQSLPFEVGVGIRTDVDEDGNLIDWPRTEPGLYQVVVDEEDDGGFEGLGNLFR